MKHANDIQKKKPQDAGGDGLALNYLNNPELTAEKFFTIQIDENETERVYRTGYLCRFLPDGNIEFLGRIDNQVKIRGFRVEPGVIEALLSQNPQVGQAKAMVRESASNGKSLVAYVAQRNGVRPEPEALRDYLKSSLPDYMVPQSYIVLDQMPVTENGKIDARALPIAEKLYVKETTDTPPTDEELKLKSIWENVLKVPNIELDDDFFELGGHSLLGMKLFAQLQRELDISLPLSVLFKAPTVRLLAREIEERPDEFPCPPQPERGISNLSKDVDSIAETTVLLKADGNLPPLFGVHGGDGGIFFYRDLAKGLADDRPFYAFEAAVLSDGGPIRKEPIEATATRYVKDLLKVQPDGPVHLCGYSFGALVAYEMACQLKNAGREIKFLGLIDTENPNAETRRLSLTKRVAANWNAPHGKDAGILEKAAKLGKRVGSGLGYRLKFEAEGAVAKALPDSKNMGWVRQTQVRHAYEEAMTNYDPTKFAGDLTLFRALEGHDKFQYQEDYSWGDVVSGKIDVVDIPGNHISIFSKNNISGITGAMRESLEKVKATP